MNAQLFEGDCLQIIREFNPDGIHLNAMQGGGYFPFAKILAPKVFVIDGPALSIAKILEQFRLEHQEKRRPAQVDSPTP